MKRCARGLLVAAAMCLPFGSVACDGDGLNNAEREALSEMVLAPLPPSPTNAVADDPDAAALGKMFYFDTRFSGPLTVDGGEAGLGPIGATGRVACVSCHEPTAGGVDQRSRGGVSVAAGFTGRASPTVLNAAYSPWLFWDGRADSLWSQALGPIEAPVEHNTSRLHVARVIHQLYKEPYETLFGALPDLDDTDRFPDTIPADPENDVDEMTTRGRPGDAYWDAMSAEDQELINRVFSNFGKAIEAYERQLVDTSSPFDRFMAGDVEAMPSAAVRGAKLFVGKASCNECHDGPAFSDGTFRNIGIPQEGEHVPAEDRGRADGIESVRASIFNGAGVFSDDESAGTKKLADIEEGDENIGAFKVPTLRNVTLGAPYMHTGAVQDMSAVMDFYNDADSTSGFVGQIDDTIEPLLLSEAELNDLAEFLAALEGDALAEDIVAPPTLP